MVFSSMTFLFAYLPITLALYFICPLWLRNPMLLIANLIFYGWGEPKYIIIMFASIMIDYIHGFLIEKYRSNDKLARKFVASSVIFNLALLFFFKYWDFLASQFGLPVLGVPLPLGISFYTFQTMSYSIDVYRGEAQRQTNLIKFGVFVTLFPQLIAGPIVRYKDIADQLTEGVKTIIKDVSEGAKLFTVGLCKKVLLANSIGKLWEVLQTNPDLSVVGAWLGAIAFSFQIYFDFAGYSDMACGLGRMLGFTFPQNFNYPYIAKSITDFWRRWHMTLGSWFREYVYIPLGGNRVNGFRKYFNIMVVWALTGFWHGADWNFIVWGIYFGVLLILEKQIFMKFLPKLPAFIQHIYTLILIVISMAIFATPQYFIEYLSKMFGNAPLFNAMTEYYLISYLPTFIILIIAATPLPKKLFNKLPEKARDSLSTILMVCGIAMTISFLVSDSYNPFLYFRF
ncbi:MAG TPA: MBOAT family protein [Candidatus Butyricicoccus avistercoris]|uniref:MBOAT family protein n=1 Tax=Candidatus Butyricicoccus avistercoris TaxID=2838518 RepID=A0A9D1PHD1_9FIRM|nr:MBOAT family protein [Candidatus Butyricicoccus avistercoris]